MPPHLVSESQYNDHTSLDPMRSSMQITTLSIVTGTEPPEIVQYAATQLSAYLDRLFGIEASIDRSPSQAQTTIYLDANGAGLTAPREPESFILRRFQRGGQPALAAVGGSPAATMWAVYDLVERWGVRYLLRGDVYPTTAGPFHLPEIDVVRKPNLRVRGVRLINLFSMGLESWSLADIKRYLDQLAKLKFNGMYHQLWCWQPFVHYEYHGHSKCVGTHWFGWHYPIDEHTIGRHHFGGVSEFVPPDFQGCETYQDRVEVGQRLLHGTFEHAKRRGFHTQISTVMTDFTPEFHALLGMPPTAPHGMGQALSGGHLGSDHEGFQQLCATAMRAYVDTYPEVDRYDFGMPEFHAADAPYEQAWTKLDEKYNFSQVRTLAQVLEETKTRTDFPGGPSRIEAAVKGDIVALELIDQLLNEKNILADCAKPDANIVFNGLSEELTEVYNLVRPASVFPSCLDYTTSRMVKRPHAFERIRQAGLRPVVIMTTQDDNIGVVPQLCTESIHDLMSILRKYDWEGYHLRYWMVGDMEPTAAYLSAASWDETVTLESAYRDHGRQICGEPAEGELLDCLMILDKITIGLGDHGLGVGFPVPTMGTGHWFAGGELCQELREDREQWRIALCHAKQARQAATRGHAYLDYLIGRLEFGIGYFDMIEMLKTAGEANKSGDRSAAIAHLERGVDLAKHIVEIHARISLVGMDLGTLAQLNEDLHRKLSRLLEDARAGKQWTYPSDGRGTAVLVES